MTGQPEPRRRDAAATRARILEAAQRAFSETGYSHTGIREIARQDKVARWFAAAVQAIVDGRDAHDDC